MNRVIVRYKLKPGRAEENTNFVRAVFSELSAAKPSGVRYATYVANDGLTFVHIASFDAGTQNPLPQMEAFKAFQKELGDRCEQKPEPVQVEEIASYGVVL